MRQAQQNRRGRGRSNSSRKSQNPLTRSYESNGPDVKIRGTPSHIAEKYVAMARDALSSGDPVLAENYLQHAEHYNRIIMTHREQQSPHGAEAGQSGQMGRHRSQPDLPDEEQRGQDSGEEVAAEAPVPRGNEPQPSLPSDDGGPSPSERRPQRRGARRERAADRDRGSDQEPRSGEQERSSGGQSNGRGGRRPRYAQTDDQPEFLKRPVRRPRAQPEPEADAPVASESSDQAAK